MPSDCVGEFLARVIPEEITPCKVPQLPAVVVADLAMLWRITEFGQIGKPLVGVRGVCMHEK